MTEYQGRHRVSGEPSSDIVAMQDAMQDAINESIAKFADLARTPQHFIRPEVPTSAEVLAEIRRRPAYGLFQVASPVEVQWFNPRPISWRETIQRWQDAFVEIGRRLRPLTVVMPFEPPAGTAEWWEWHYGSVIFDEHLGMLEMPPGKGLATGRQ